MTGVIAERKKDMKKGLVYLLVGALSVSMLAGCGSKGSKKGSKVTVEMSEVLENVANAATDIESMEVGIKGSLDGKLTLMGTSATASGSVDLTGKASLKEPSFYADGKLEYKLDAGDDKLEGDYAATAYGVNEDDEMTLYAKIADSDWVKESMNVSDVEDAISQMKEILEDAQKTFSDLSSDDLKEVEEYLTLENTTKTVNGKECYVLSAKIDKDQLLKLYQDGSQYASDFDTDYENYAATIEGLDSLSLTYSFCFDKSTYLPVKVDFNATLKGDIEGADVEIKKFNIEVNFGINDVTVPSVPDDVKESAIESGSAYDYDDYDYDYDYDDYDYDYDYDDED